MSFLTLALRLPAKSFDDCVRLLASDPALLAVTQRYGGWLLPHAGEKNLVARAQCLLAEQAMCHALDADYRPPPLVPAAGSTLVLKIHPDRGGDRQLCAVKTAYRGCCKTFGAMPEKFREMRLIRENPELLACFAACPNKEKSISRNLPMTHDRIIRYEPDLRPDVEGPPDAWQGLQALLSWLEGEPLALALRYKTTDADVRACLAAYGPSMIEQLRPHPGPYAQYVAEADAKTAMNEIDELILGAAPSPRRR